jgi:tRNA(Arg) A34 adenosine deaminase TadA
MSEMTDPMQERQDAHFMELALRQSATAVSRGQTPFGQGLTRRHGRVSRCCGNGENGPEPAH